MEDKLLNLVVDTFVKHGLTAACLPATMILSELLDKFNIPNRIIDGWLYLPQIQKSVVYHLFVTVAGSSNDPDDIRWLDPGKDAMNNIFRTTEYRTVLNIPEGYQRADLDTFTEMRNYSSIKALLERYEEDGVMIWAGAPKKYLLARKDIMDKLESPPKRK